MLTDGRFWIGILVGAAACHFIKARMAAKATG